jgi:hypothetical protein
MATIDERLARGSRAKEVLENEEFIAAWSRVESELIESWKNTPSTNANRDARERIHLSITLLGKVKACITETMETGKLAQADLIYKQSRLQQARDWLTPT